MTTPAQTATRFISADRRLASLTATLARRGVLPAFYRTPRKQAALGRKLRRELGALLGGIGASLLSGLDTGAVSPANEFQMDGALAVEAGTIGEGVQEAYQSAYLESAREAFQGQARYLFRRAGIELSWELAEPRAAEILRDLSFQASQKLMERVTGDVKSVLLRGVEEGLGTRETGGLLRDEIRDLSTRQAEGIARTEVNSAANRGGFLAMEEAQVEYVQWIAAQDARTRPGHLARHGMVVRRGQRFPGWLLHPGDRDGTPTGEWVNCRCAAAAYFPLRSELGQQTPFVGMA